MKSIAHLTLRLLLIVLIMSGCQRKKRYNEIVLDQFEQLMNEIEEADRSLYENVVLTSEKYDFILFLLEAGPELDRDDMFTRR